MNRLLLRIFILVLLFPLVARAETSTIPVSSQPNIVLDMDFGNGIDDAMTLRLFLLAAQRGEIHPLAVTLSNPSEWTFPAAQYLMDTLLPGNTIPLGRCHEDIGLALEDYTHPLAESHGKSPGGGENAVAVLRRVLAAAPDNSVRLVCTGFGTNLAALLESQPEVAGELSGTDLVQKKVELLVLMAGLSEDPEQRSFNVIHNIGAFRIVVEEWPTPIYLVTPDLGEEVLLDLDGLESSLSVEDPYTELVRLLKERKSFHHDPRKIPSWDQVAFLFAAYPKESLYTPGPNMRMTVVPNGILKAWPGEPADPTRQVILRANGTTPEQIATLLMERYLMRPR